ncbi:hypothetical protein CHE218_09470 [Microbacterium sp. che218]
MIVMLFAFCPCFEVGDRDTDFVNRQQVEARGKAEILDRDSALDVNTRCGGAAGRISRSRVDGRNGSDAGRG